VATNDTATTGNSNIGLTARPAEAPADQPNLIKTYDLNYFESASIDQKHNIIRQAVLKRLRNTGLYLLNCVFARMLSPSVCVFKGAVLQTGKLPQKSHTVINRQQKSPRTCQSALK
jgi:hypothetical protein